MAVTTTAMVVMLAGFYLLLGAPIYLQWVTKWEWKTDTVGTMLRQGFSASYIALGWFPILLHNLITVSEQQRAAAERESLRQFQEMLKNHTPQQPAAPLKVFTPEDEPDGVDERS